MQTPFVTRCKRRGSSLVEGALTATLLIFTLIGIVDISTVLVLHQGLVERVRAGARYGVVRPFSTTKISNVVLYNAEEPGPGARPLLNLTPDLVSVNLYNQNTPEARIEVRITSYPFHLFTPFITGNYLARPIVCSMPLEDQGGGAS